MNGKVEVTERTIQVINQIYHNNFENDDPSKMKNIEGFQRDILNEIIYLENEITGIDYIIEKNNKFIQELISQKIKFTDILKIYNENLNSFKNKREIFTEQRYIFQRFADILPFSIFPRDLIRKWIKLEKPGFLSFKTGLSLELDTLFNQTKNKFKILCDLTNCMRIGDIYTLSDKDQYFLECKLRNTNKEKIVINIQSLVNKTKKNAEEDKHYIESDLKIRYCTNDIHQLLLESYKNLVLEKNYSDILYYHVVNWNTEKKISETIKLVNNFASKIPKKNVIGNSSLISQILIDDIAPIFLFGFSVESLIDLFLRRINLVNYVDIDKLNQKLMDLGKNWKFDINNYHTVIDGETHKQIGQILYPWTLFLNEFLSLESFIDYCDYLIKFIRSNSNLII
jgi:hypothetical protein